MSLGGSQPRHELLAPATVVLPLRFGTVMATKDGGRGPTCACQEAFAAALKEAEGRVQYVVKGRYVEQAVLAEALAEVPEAARLRKRIRGKDRWSPANSGSLPAHFSTTVVASP